MQEKGLWMEGKKVQDGRTQVGVRVHACVHKGTFRGIEEGLPLGVHSGDIEGNSLEPEHHEQSLGEGAVSDLGPITASLYEQFDLRLFFNHGCDQESSWNIAN